MKHRDFKPRHLDITAFAEAGTDLDGQTPLHELERLAASTYNAGELPAMIAWHARAELRPQSGSAPELWLHLTAQTSIALECQRCLEPAQHVLDIDNWFRFAATEEQAAALDAESDHDVLAQSVNFDLLELIEDELLLALPVIPRHEVCPPSVVDAHTVGTSAEGHPDDAAGEARPDDKPNPFAVLASLRRGPVTPESDGS